MLAVRVGQSIRRAGRGRQASDDIDAPRRQSLGKSFEAFEGLFGVQNFQHTQPVHGEIMGAPRRPFQSKSREFCAPDGEAGSKRTADAANVRSGWRAQLIAATHAAKVSAGVR